MSYLSDETILELHSRFLEGTSGGSSLIVVCGIITLDGIQIHSEPLENNKVFIREENTINPRIGIHTKQKISTIYLFQDYCGFPRETIKRIYVVPYGTVKNSFEIDYKWYGVNKRMKVEFKIAERKENAKSKYVASLTTVEVKLKGNKDLINEIYECINKNIIDKDRIVY